MEDEVTLVDKGLDLLDDLFSVARRRQDAPQFFELELEAMDLFTELREFSLRGTTLLDLGVEVFDLRLSGLDLSLHVFDQEVIGCEHQTAGEDDADG